MLQAPTIDKEGHMEAAHVTAAYSGPQAGEQFLLVGAELITIKLRGAAYSAFEDATQGGYGGPPPHRHLRQDEGFYVLEGTFTFHVEGQAIPATVGTFVNVPKGRLHTFENTGPGIGRLLGIVAPPGDFEGFVVEVGERVSLQTPPPLPAGPPDAATVGRIVAAGARHHLEIPPPPDV
jgi:mannose-6-phosphate isomerase-like protein (cupin superfamily)